MNKIQITINVILVAAVATLFGLYFAGKKSPVAEPIAQSELLPVAYVNMDSLLLNYTFAQEANEKLMKKQEDARLKLNTKARSLQSEMADFQHKLENNAFLSRERAEKEQQRLIQKQQDLQELEAKLTEEIMLENQNLNIQLADTLTKFIQEFNADGRYHIILTNTANDNILVASEQYDVTPQVLEALNKRYKK